MKNKLSACVIPFKCYAKISFLEVHAWLHYIDNETSPVLYEKQGQIAMVLKYNCDNDTQVNLYS